MNFREQRTGKAASTHEDQCQKPLHYDVHLAEAFINERTLFVKEDARIRTIHAKPLLP